MSAKNKKLMGHIGRWIAIVVVAVVFLFPLFWMVLASFKQPLDITNPTMIFQFKPTISNYERVMEQHNFGQYIINSAIIAVAAVGVSLVLAVPASYVFTKYAMNRSSGLLLVARIIPGITLLVPWYWLFSQLGMVDTYLPLILSHMFVTMPLIAWIMLSFFAGIPEELEQAGLVDGLTPIGVFGRIALPLSTPGIATAAILGFIFSWNNFMFALVLSGANTRTLPVAIFNFVGYASIDWGGLMAASVVITFPVMLGALFTQKYIVSGLTAGATKG